MQQFLCPSCPQRPALALRPGTLAEFRCPQCQGSFLRAQDARSFLTTRLKQTDEMLSGAYSAGAPTGKACCSCNTALMGMRLPAGLFEVCGACGALWAGASVLTRAIAFVSPQAGSPSSPGTPAAARQAPDTAVRQLTKPAPPRQATTRKAVPVRGGTPWGLVAGALAVIGLAGGGLMWMKSSKPKAAQVVVEEDSYLNIQSNIYDIYEFGGRALPWWTKRVRLLRKDATPEGQKQLAVLMSRASAIGLSVEELPEGPTMRVSKELALSIRKRLTAQ